MSKDLQRTQPTARDGKALPDPEPPTTVAWRGEVLYLTPTGIDADGMGAHLRSAGFAFRVRKPGPEVVTETLTHVPVLILVTVAPGDESSLDVLRRIQGELGPLAPAAMALVSGEGEGTEEVLLRAYSAGVRDALSLPVPPPLLRVKVSRTARTAAVSEQRIGRYEVKRMLGRGGMGAVYLAESGPPEARHEVALKVLDGNGPDPEALARFRREAEVLRSLEGDNVPRLLDVGRADDVFYFAMDFVPGETLESVLEAGPLGELAVERLLDDLAAALGVVHAAGYVHRDVKPSNVILAPDGTARLIDFGLTKPWSDNSLTGSHHVLGTAPYLPPEAFHQSELVDPQGDVFALGILGIEALLGYNPAHDTSANRRATGVVPDAEKLLPGIDPDLRHLLARMVDPTPTDRPTPSQIRTFLRRGGELRWKLAARQRAAHPDPGG